MFETFHCPYFHISLQSVLALYASGRTTGLSIDIGEGLTQAFPIYEGLGLFPSVSRTDMAGRALTTYLMQLLSDKGYQFSSTSDRDVAREIKEKECIVASDYSAELSKGETKEYELPNGQKITLGNERFRVGEALFQPSLIGRSEPGLPEFLRDCINKSDLDTRRDFWGNIVVAGGTTYLKNFEYRLQEEMSKLAHPGIRVKVVAPEERKYSVWIGGSILASLFTFGQMWISLPEYQEEGVACVHRKCY
jgi:actin beta/gamma 1